MTRPPTPAARRDVLRCIGWGCAAVAAISVLIGQNIAYSVSPQPVPATRVADLDRHGPASISYDTVNGRQVACLHQDNQVACVDLDEGNPRNS